jgi:hypothetical protein
MKLRWVIGLVAALGALATSAACAEPTPQVRAEVNFLLGYVEGSGCDFDRNGTWYKSPAAQRHLRDKFNYLVARDLIHTTEDFVQHAASESSFTGRPYRVRCQSKEPVASKQWLIEELARLRELK